MWCTELGSRIPDGYGSEMAWVWTAPPSTAWMSDEKRGHIRKSTTYQNLSGYIACGLTKEKNGYVCNISNVSIALQRYI